MSEYYVEWWDVLQEVNQAVKIRVNEVEPRTVESFRLVLPTVFGEVKEAYGTVKYLLPWVKDYQTWNPHDNISGTQWLIEQGMDDQKIQVHQDIYLAFGDRQEEMLPALDLHEGAQTFMAEICGWINASSQELLTMSNAAPAQAWDLTSACIKKVFEELRWPRAAAVNMSLDPNATSKCSTYLWAILQAQCVMKDFIEGQFRNTLQ